MSRSWWPSWRRDLLVAVVVSLLTALALAPFAWASYRRQENETQAARQNAEDAARLAEQKAAEADQQRALAHKAMIQKAADFAGFDRADADFMNVSSDAVAPEVPKGAWLVIDKKATSYAVGDVVVFRDDGRNYLGRVVAYDKGAGRLTVARNGEKNREIAAAALLGRGVLNTR